MYEIDFGKLRGYVKTASAIEQKLKVLELLRASKSKKDKNIQEAIKFLEFNLSDDIADLGSYLYGKRTKINDKVLLTPLLKAKKYRQTYPYKYEEGRTKELVESMFKQLEKN